MLKLIVTRERKRRRPKSETLTFNLPKIQSKMLQLIQNALKLVSKRQNQRNREEMEENGAKIEALESLKNPKSRQTSRSV